MSKELYEWQEECLKRWFENNGRGMVQAVTGAGKTFLALSAAERLDRMHENRLRIKIVVPTGELMRQWEHSLREFLSEIGKDDRDSGRKGKQTEDFRHMIGLRGGGYKARPDYKYMIYVINSARYELARQILAELRGGESVLIIADECHHYGSGQNQLIFEFLTHLNADQRARFFSLGLTATLPAGQTRRYLSSVLGPGIYSYGMKEAAAQNAVCEYDIYHIGLSLTEREKEAYDELSEQIRILYRNLVRRCPFLKELKGKERFETIRSLAAGDDKTVSKMALGYLQMIFKRKSLVCMASERIFSVCDLIENLPFNEKIIIFGERICQAEELYQLLQEQYPERVGRYHSQMGQQANKNVIERFREGAIRILITCKSLDEGIDIPEVSVGIILSGTSVKRQRVQRMGRIIRKAEGKERASLYYLHTADTAEDVCFLPDTGKEHIFELEYASGSFGFMNREYDKKAEELLAQMEEDGADERKMNEVKRCLRRGSVRSDWKLSREVIERKIEEAKYVEEKNYWVCMKRVCER